MKRMYNIILAALPLLGPTLHCSIPVRELKISTEEHFSDSLHKSGLTGPSSYNQIQVLTRGNETFQSLHYRISQARSSVFFSAYIFQTDSTGKRLMDLLKRKASEGLDVRLMLDAWGSIYFEKEMEVDLRESGVRIQYFRPLEILRPYRHLLRNHRRLIVIDGQYALTGGFAIQDVWADLYDFQIQDLQVWIQGPMVQEMESLFIRDWCLATEKEDSLCNLDSSSLAMETIPSPDSRHPRKPLPGPNSACNSFRQGCTGLASLLPTSEFDNPSANYNFYLGAISHSKRRIWMVTPYFIPDARFLTELEKARKRGVDVRLVMASSETIQEFPVNYVRNPYVEALLRMGARVYVYESGFLHSKASLFDENLSLIGTSNLDRRSFNYNHELDIVSYDYRTNDALDTVFQRYMKSSRELTREELESRSLTVRLLELFWWPLIPQL